MDPKTKGVADLSKVQDIALEFQKETEAEQIEVVHGDIRIVITANQKVKIVEVGGVPDEKLRIAIENAIMKSQKAAAEKLSQLPNRMFPLDNASDQG